LKAADPIRILGSRPVCGVPLIGKSDQSQAHVVVIGQIHAPVRTQNGRNRVNLEIFFKQTGLLSSLMKLLHLQFDFQIPNRTLGRSNRVGACPVKLRAGIFRITHDQLAFIFGTMSSGGRLGSELAIPLRMADFFDSTVPKD
jgi:hypothetical protein